MSQMNSLKIKLLIPTFLIALLIAIAITYISVLHYRIFEQQHEYHSITHLVELEAATDETIIKLKKLAEFLAQDWRVLNGLVIGDRDALLDLVIPFHDAMDFNIINIYNAKGHTVIKADNESVFGIADELYPQILRQKNRLFPNLQSNFIIKS